MSNKQRAVSALENMKSDNLYRARSSWRYLSPAQMDEQYGESGKTRNQIIAEYEQHEQECNAAIAWVKAQAD